MTYLQLFLSFLQIGALSFGGGYAAMPLIQEQIVTRHGWLSMGEFTDLVTIAEMTPGPIAINAATFVGTRVAGIPGAMAATVGCILPACILVTLIARLYLKYRDLAVLQGVLGSLQRFKDSVKEVAQGYECGLSFEKYNDIKVGDVVEAYVMEQIEQ